MAYPPVVPPATRTNATPQADNHPADHNGISAALTDIVNVLGPNPAQGYSNVTEKFDGRLPTYLWPSVDGGRFLPYTAKTVAYFNVSAAVAGRPAMLMWSVTAYVISPPVVAEYKVFNPSLSAIFSGRRSLSAPEDGWGMSLFMFPTAGTWSVSLANPGGSGEFSTYADGTNNSITMFIL